MMPVIARTVIVAGLIGAIGTTIPSAAISQNASKPGDWRVWLAGIVDNLEDAARTKNRDLFNRRVDRPIQFLASAQQLPEQYNVRIFCTLAAQSASNYASSLKRGSAKSAHVDLTDYRKYDRDCAEAIDKAERDTALKAASALAKSTTDFPAIPSSPKDWLASVRSDASTALEAIKRGRVDPALFGAIASSAVAARARISAWEPAPKNSSAYGICGDAVIALSKLEVAPRAALDEFYQQDALCAAAIGK